MAIATEPAQTKTFCVNHPQTETLIKCNRCGKPVCMKCVQRTPVGYRCNECLGQQRAGYYNASTFDYGIAAIIGIVLGAIGGLIMSFIGGFGFFAIIIAIFVGPIAGGIISEAIRLAISKRRARYLALVACVAIAVGALGVLFLPALPFIARGGIGILARFVLNIGFWISLALTLSTAYARLRT